MSAVVGTRSSSHRSTHRTSWISLNFGDLRETPDARVPPIFVPSWRVLAERGARPKEEVEEMIRRLTLFAAVLLSAAAAALTFPPSTASDAGVARAHSPEQAVRVDR
jgi:hypothetical protein